MLAIIDWERSGWMPAFWEAAKLKYWMMGHGNTEVMERLPDITGDIPDDVFMAFAMYMNSWGV